MKVPLQVVAPLTYKRLNGVKLSLSGDHQLVNAGLAVSLCKSWLKTTRNWGKLFQNVSSHVWFPLNFSFLFRSIYLCMVGSVLCFDWVKWPKEKKFAHMDTSQKSHKLYLYWIKSPNKLKFCRSYLTHLLFTLFLIYL